VSEKPVKVVVDAAGEDGWFTTTTSSTFPTRRESDRRSWFLPVPPVQFIFRAPPLACSPSLPPAFYAEWRFGVGGAACFVFVARPAAAAAAAIPELAW